MISNTLGRLDITDREEKLKCLFVMSLLIGIFLIILGLIKSDFIEYIISYSTISGFIMAASFIVGFEQLAKIFSIKVNYFYYLI